MRVSVTGSASTVSRDTTPPGGPLGVRSNRIRQRHHVAVTGIRYHARHRSRGSSSGPFATTSPAGSPSTDSFAFTARAAATPAMETEAVSTRRGRRSWAEMLRRVFAVDVLRCAMCSSRTTVLAADLNHPADRALLLPAARAARPPPATSGLKPPFPNVPSADAAQGRATRFPGEPSTVAENLVSPGRRAPSCSPSPQLLPPVDISVLSDVRPRRGLTLPPA